MLIPSIDLQRGCVVQLEQGVRQVFATDDLDGWVRRFSTYPLVQVIDLDAAMGQGSNVGLVRRLCARIPCQVGGGVRSIDDARALLAAGARRLIVGSAFFDERGPRADVAAAFSEAVGAEALVAAVDSRGGQVVVRGWTQALPVTAVEAIAALEAHVGAFLYTHVDTEGLLGGTNMDAILAVQRATRRPVIAAGGIRSMAEVDALDAVGIDAVVGMAIYRGLIQLGS
jgi:phosphoribosylformimino-5-aminoimidazole carboxamide ribotide isomerase